MYEARKNTHSWILLTDEPLDIQGAFDFLRTEHTGALNVFVGTTRSRTGERQTERLSYEAHIPMALHEMEKLAQQVMKQWPVHRVCLLHRLGEVPAGEASVITGVATPHRAESFAACRWLIDTLKRQVPIWKKEIYTDGSQEWVLGHTPDVS